jgi:hypothetical protein
LERDLNPVVDTRVPLSPAATVMTAPSPRYSSWSCAAPNSTPAVVPPPNSPFTTVWPSTKFGPTSSVPRFVMRNAAVTGS